MFLDALIAVSSKRAGATVAINDYDDFKAIQYYCPVKLLRGSDFFKSQFKTPPISDYNPAPNSANPTMGQG